jgi:hypothetical protein
MSLSVGAFFALSSAAAAISWPDWQYPHCGTWRSIHARCSCRPSAVEDSASIVVIDRLPTALTGMLQLLLGTPSI